MRACSNILCLSNGINVFSMSRIAYVTIIIQQCASDVKNLAMSLAHKSQDGSTLNSMFINDLCAQFLGTTNILYICKLNL